MPPACLPAADWPGHSRRPAGAKLVFRFEPFILHVECRSMAAAQRVLQVARQAGYRESGAVPSELTWLMGLMAYPILSYHMPERLQTL
jgi:tRNA(Phe) wybutosine-synthesizing methylase Tyw3